MDLTISVVGRKDLFLRLVSELWGFGVGTKEAPPKLFRMGVAIVCLRGEGTASLAKFGVRDRAEAVVRWPLSRGVSLSGLSLWLRGSTSKKKRGMVAEDVVEKGVHKRHGGWLPSWGGITEGATRKGRCACAM